MKRVLFAYINFFNYDKTFISAVAAMRRGAGGVRRGARGAGRPPPTWRPNHRDQRHRHHKCIPPPGIYI
jgi:hypothetical protein